jgi:serine/threonine protein kinase
MHGAGVGHLDLKPSNVILRDPDGLAGPQAPGAPVLVDFGLAGRHIRPGCATGEYGAPEIWGGLGDPTKFAPMAADVYAFGALAYEVLTRRTLFEAPTEMALITAHIGHDGRPPGVAELAKTPATSPVAELVYNCLRRDPKERESVPIVRKRLRDLRRRLGSAPWPLSA